MIELLHALDSTLTSTIEETGTLLQALSARVMLWP